MRHFDKTPLRKDEMMRYDKSLCLTIIIAFIFAFVIGCFFSVGSSYASVPDDEANHPDQDIEAVSSGSDSDASHHALYSELSAKAESILQQLKSIPDTQDEAELITIRQTCLTAYTEYSELFDRADEAYDAGSIDTLEYAELIELLNNTADDLSAQFDRFGFDPYAISQSYYIAVNSSSIARLVPTYVWSASYNGSNLVINFDFQVADC